MALGLALCFFVIALVHVYWAFGGTKGLHLALPERAAQPVFKPGPLPTLVVAVGMLAVVACILRLSPQIHWDVLAGLPVSWARTSLGLLTVALLLRAVGDFHYVGWGKCWVKRGINHTSFAKMDTRFYVPLCLLLASGLLTMLV